VSVVAKIVFRKFDRKQQQRNAPPPVQQKNVIGPDGGIHKVHTLDAGSKSFASDLQYVFTKNIERIRRTNKKVLGVTDFVPHNP
jgi:hypothetical protein